MNEENMNSGTTGMIVNERMKADLLASAKWAKFLCIIGCIGVALLVIIAIAMFVLGGSMNTVLPNSGFGAAVGFVYLFMAVIYIYPLIMGFQFANGTKAGCLNNDENELARGFEGMRSWFNYIGILTIICLVLYALIIIGAFIAGFAAASKF